jgi:retron-type reverse transcriptase
MSNRLINFLDANHCLFKRQFGFRSKHSTEHALISLTESIRKSLDSGQFACGIFIDLQKAFDTVDHEILLTKLKHYGIRGIGSSWFRSFLSNRSQFVEINGIKSTTITILYGVPQGSVLGPLLFLIYCILMICIMLFAIAILISSQMTLLFCFRVLLSNP